MERVLCFVMLMRTVATQWGYGVGGFGNGNPPPYPPPNNNNVGVGYPTAYGLWLARGNNNGGAVSPHTGNSLRCLNGGAHIGQCRLDNDAICTALGGGCVHGACCTTPFIGLSSSTTTIGPEVDGEVTRKSKKSTVISTTSPSSMEKKEGDEFGKFEIAEFRRIVEYSRSTLAPEEPWSPNRHCHSGLRPVGPCSEDADCPTLHRCEMEKCCYIV